MSKIKNYFHEEIEQTANERHEQTEPEINKQSSLESQTKYGVVPLGWTYNPRYHF